MERTKAEKLAEIVKEAMGNIGLKGYAHWVQPGTANFANILAEPAERISRWMNEEPTSSHSAAWQRELRAGKFALKLYKTRVYVWHITIVTTGWRHKLDSAMFHLHFFGSKEINLRNAKKYKKLISSR